MKSYIWEHFFCYEKVILGLFCCFWPIVRAQLLGITSQYISKGNFSVRSQPDQLEVTDINECTSKSWFHAAALFFVSGPPKVQCVTKSCGTGSAGLASRHAVGPNIAHPRSNFVWITGSWKQKWSEVAICVIVRILPCRPSNLISLLPVNFYILWGGYQSCD